MTKLHLRVELTQITIYLRAVYLGIFVVAMTGILGCSGMGSTKQDFPIVYEPKVIELSPKKLTNESPLTPEQQSKIKLLSQLPGAKIQLIQTTTGIAPHYHKNHDEIVFILQGRGIAIIKDTRTKVGPGSMLIIPRKTVHAFRPMEGETHVALSIEIPALKKDDRVFVDMKE